MAGKIFGKEVSSHARVESRCAYFVDLVMSQLGQEISSYSNLLLPQICYLVQSAPPLLLSDATGVFNVIVDTYAISSIICLIHRLG